MYIYMYIVCVFNICCLLYCKKKNDIHVCIRSNKVILNLNCCLFCIAFAYAYIVLYRPICVLCSVAVFLLANIRDSYKLWLCISAVVSGDFDSLILDRFCSILVRIGSCCHGSSRQFE